MICPSCVQAIKMNPLYLGKEKFRFEECPNCKGLWCNGGVLELALQIAAKNITTPENPIMSKRHCPHHPTKNLVETLYPQTQVIIDICPICFGLWLDKGEFNEIIKTRHEMKAEGLLEGQGIISDIRLPMAKFIDKAITFLIRNI